MIIKEMGREAASVFNLILVIAILGSIYATFYVYSEYLEYVGQTEKTYEEILDELNDLRARLEIIEKFVPEALLGQMFEAGSISMTYLEVMNFSIAGANTKAIVFNNSGGYPLADFEILLNNEEIEPYYKSQMVFPSEKGIVVLYPLQASEWHMTEGTVEIKSAQGVSEMIRTGISPTGLTGYFVLRG